MTHSPDTIRAALLLTNRLVPLAASPLTAREFWKLVAEVDPGALLHAEASTIAERAGVDAGEATRLRTLLDAATALSFEEDRLHDGGVSLVSALDESFPDALRVRLGSACPPFLLVAGPIEWLGGAALGVVGSRDASAAATDVARAAAAHAVAEGWAVVSGLARGVDQVAMAGALDGGGRVIGVPAEGILRAARSAEVRRRVHRGELCIASPYAPDAPFRVGNAMGRNKIVYALSRATLVVAADESSGGSWAGAVEALDRRFASVAVWAGEGAGDGNLALIRRGATPIRDLSELFALPQPSPPPPVADRLF